MGSMYNLVKENNPILQECMPEISLSDVSELKPIAEKMLETMRMKGGVGLAAPQVGLELRMFVMLAGGEERICINPSFEPANVDGTNTDEQVDSEEGCLSYPKLYLKVKRHKTIKAQYVDLDGKIVETILTGLPSRCFQHELDHLNGITFTARVSKLVLSLGKKRRAKLLRRGK